MKRKTLITMFIALGVLVLGGIGHAFQDFHTPTGAVAKGEIVGNKLMLQGANGKLAPAPDGAYKVGGKSIVVKGGKLATGLPARGGSMMDKPGDKPTPPLPDKKGQMVPPSMGSPAATRGGMAMEPNKTKDKVVKESGGKKKQMMPPGMGSPAATRGGQAMESDKPTKPDESDQGPPPKPDKIGQMMADPATPGQGPLKATPMPQGIKGPAGATPMPQGTQGSTPPLGSPKDPMGPGAGSRPGVGPPPPSK